jgi:hypothetical protein
MKAPHEEVGGIIAQGAHDVNWILGRQASEVLPVCLSGHHLSCDTKIYKTKSFLHYQEESQETIANYVAFPPRKRTRNSTISFLRHKGWMQGSHHQMSLPTHT